MRMSSKAMLVMHKIDIEIFKVGSYEFPCKKSDSYLPFLKTIKWQEWEKESFATIPFTL